MAAAHDSHDTFNSSQDSNPDTSNLSFESSFRLDSSYSSQNPDCEKHPKGKRKRTTTQDKSILESAYSSNPKPDKAARLDIVERVTLNEKEVQIWFQNRRQNDRRKSRPLSPQEIEALRYGGGISILSSDPAPTSIEPVPASIGLQRAAEQFHETPVDGRACVDAGRTASSAQDDAGPQNPFQASSPKPVEAVQLLAEDPAKAEVQVPEAATPPGSQKAELENDSHALSQASIASVGYLSNRWNAGNLFSTPSTLGRPGDDSFRLDSFPSSTASTVNNSPSILPPPSNSSQVRLSLSLDGKAGLVSSQPSPPRPVAPQLPLDVETLPPVRSNRTLQRSRSALPGITLPPISTLTAHLPPQLSRGRSRDVHAWESCCETDSRDELTRQAENESSGSAIAAISLLRSSSSSASLNNLVNNHSSPNVLQSNPGKRNSPAHKTSGRGGAKKPKLSRASSSIARMQSLPPVSFSDRPTARETASEVLQVLEPEKKSALSVILSPSGDSDKENWSPDEEGNPSHRRRPLPPPVSRKSPELPTRRGAKNSRRAGRVLGEQDRSGRRTPLGSKRANTAPSPRPRGGKMGNALVLIFEDGEKENAGAEQRARGPGKRDNEVERFMRGEVSPSKKPDMDCIAGLLSLSQGNWR
ncbi:Uu.00g045690.m01.CDS01 [Anthostomella pinea]|uniref:Uu.00g045690.m01.CDS01 n=1 Tax=Anthostomella pinea TaxID=933095 RepID=A0AAI8VC77_9PEZI|nr:Uu.00g045690.m01.CDS01 [Anthostomella pinea]